ncbi:MAG: EscU/YscU/HrcU family type III secretion system export apparatus switch protein [Dehalococcoidia bacterium]
MRYDPETMAAPTVIAGGKDFGASRHPRGRGRGACVPIVENPPLARALHKLTPVGREIPAQLYVAVAEVLAFVFRLRQRQTAA